MPFSEADKNVSLLTWAAQIKEGELLEFILARADPQRHAAEFAQWKQEAARINEEVRQQEAARGRLPPGGVGLEMMKSQCDPRQSLKMACILTRNVMAQLADQGTVKGGNIKRMIDLATYVSQPALSFDGSDERDLPAGGVSFQPRATTNLAADDLALRVLLELQSLFPDKVGLVKRCEECRNPFVRHIHREQQRFCSHRCGNRANMRRARAGEPVEEENEV